MQGAQPVSGEGDGTTNSGTTNSGTTKRWFDQVEDVVIDTSVAHPARRYDYLLGGKTNYAADRASGDAILAVHPQAGIDTRENRKFLSRVVTTLAREHGITQFLDIGTGIPSAGNTHEVAQRIHPAARVLYVDNDPVVLAHARALMSGTPDGATAFILADLRRPEDILDHPQLTQVLDLSQPVALMLIFVLHFLVDADQPKRIVSQLVQALPAGSFLAVSHAASDLLPPATTSELTTVASTSAFGPFRARTRAEVADFFTGLDLLTPGIVPVNQWRHPHPQPDRPVGAYAALARIP